LDTQPHLTRLLIDWKNGDSRAVEQLTPIVYGELRRLADHYLRNESAADTLQPTALVHEAYLRLVAQDMPDWQCRSHFFGVAAHLMRQILVDHARMRRSHKRGGGVPVVSLDDVPVFAREKSSDILALDDALTALATLDQRQCRIIELRYFAGFSLEETAQAVGVSVATIRREQRIAEAWLHRELSEVT